MERIRALIIDDHPDVRRALSERLSNSDLIEVTASARDISGGRALFGPVHPDAVLLGLRAQDAPRDLTTIADLATDLSHHHAALLVLTSYSFEDERDEIMRAGARRYLLKDIDTQHLIEEIVDSITECRTAPPEETAADKPEDPTVLPIE
ncbi:MAG: response regulator [Anaerolineales bacterium]